MKILDKITLTDFEGVKINKITVYAPDIAEKAGPGQFVVLMVEECGERIPLTIAGKNSNKGSIDIVFQEIGLTTKLLGKLNKGDSLYSIIGPLGHKTTIPEKNEVMLIAGGVGIAEILPVAKNMKEKNNKVTVIIGARNKNLIFFEKELSSIADNFYITTDDGSYGIKGFTSNIAEKLFKEKHFDLVYAVGPIPMMEVISKITEKYKIKTIVSLNPLMVDGTGMCGCCRVVIKDKVKFACVDGPEFDAHSVDWKELKIRNTMYVDKEKHICNLNFEK